MSDSNTSARTQEPPHGRQSESELFMLAGIGAIIRWCEELASLLAGPVLTLGLGIALVDLFTDGKLLATTPALLFAWAISQTVGLDAQLVGSAAKLGGAVRRRSALPIVGYALLVVALGYVAFQASNVFATQQAEGITTAQALARLGMDNATWIIERSALAVFLVILSGLLRYVAPAKIVASLEDERGKLERELTLEPLRQRLRAQQVGGMRALAQTAFGAHAHTPDTSPDDEPPPTPSPDGPRGGGRDAAAQGGRDDLAYAPPVPNLSGLTPFHTSSLPPTRTSGNGRTPAAQATAQASRKRVAGKSNTTSATKNVTRRRGGGRMLTYAQRHHARVLEVRGWLAEGETVSKQRIRKAFRVDNRRAGEILAEAGQQRALHMVRSANGEVSA